jgi:uncharacterized GH25 family protein
MIVRVVDVKTGKPLRGIEVTVTNCTEGKGPTVMIAAVAKTDKHGSVAIGLAEPVPECTEVRLLP